MDSKRIAFINAVPYGSTGKIVKGIAKIANTINYEISCAVTRRVPKIIIENGEITVPEGLENMAPPEGTENFSFEDMPSDMTPPDFSQGMPFGNGRQPTENSEETTDKNGETTDNSHFGGRGGNREFGGMQDKVTSGAATLEIAEKLDCESYLYEDLGHAAYEEAKDFNQRVYDFFVL